MTSSAQLDLDIDSEIFDLAPSYVLGLLWCDDLQAPRELPAAQLRLAAAELRLRTAFTCVSELDEAPAIASWQEVYRHAGVNPRRFPHAAASLARRVIKAGALPRIGVVVDECNAVSLDMLLPVASCDLGSITERGLTLRRARGDEPFVPLGYPDEVENPDTGEVIYADGLGRAHSRRWNWRQSHAVMTRPDTRRALITVEAVHPGGAVQVNEALDRLAAVVGVHAGGYRRVVLDQQQPSSRSVDAVTSLS